MPWGSGSFSSAKDLRSPKFSALALAISLTVQAAPWSAIIRRQAASVNPAMGANTAPSGICRFFSCMGYLVFQFRIPFYHICVVCGILILYANGTKGAFL